MIKRPNSSTVITVAVAVLIATGVFVVIASGLNLGPRSKKREATSASATFAAEEFVRQVIQKQVKHNEGQEPHLIFSEQGSNAERDLDNISMWIVSGKARLGAANLQWSVWEEWDGEHEWVLKAIQIIGPQKKSS